MLRLIWTVSVQLRYFMRRYMPTDILLDALRTRRGLRWRLPAMLLAIPYLYAASLSTVLIDHGAPGWLNLFALICLWNALRFIAIGPLSLALLWRSRPREAEIVGNERDALQPATVPPREAEPIMTGTDGTDRQFTGHFGSSWRARQCDAARRRPLHSVHGIVGGRR